MIVLHQIETSPFCEKVRRMLHFKRRAYETREVPPTEALVSLGRVEPGGRVPVIEHAGNVVADSTEIARYLEAAFPEPPLLPADPRELALCHLLEDWADESLYFYELFFRFGLKENAPEWSRRTSESEPPLLRRATERALPTVMRNVLRAQGIGRRAPERVVESFAALLGSLESLLDGRDWLVSDRLTLADIAVYAQLACACDTGEGAALLGDRPRLVRWMERVNASTLPTA